MKGSFAWRLHIGQIGAKLCVVIVDGSRNVLWSLFLLLHVGVRVGRCFARMVFPVPSTKDFPALDT